MLQKRLQWRLPHTAALTHPSALGLLSFCTDCYREKGPSFYSIATKYAKAPTFTTYEGIQAIKTSKDFTEDQVTGSANPALGFFPFLTNHLCRSCSATRGEFHSKTRPGGRLRVKVTQQWRATLVSQ